MSLFNKEVHLHLRDGKGVVTTYTSEVKLFGHRRKIIILVLTPKSSIGVHKHTEDSEVYVTLDPCIRFSQKKKWRLFNHCRIGGRHCAENTSSKRKAVIFAYKY